MCNDVASHKIIEIPHYSQYLIPQQQQQKELFIFSVDATWMS